MTKSSKNRPDVPSRSASAADTRAGVARRRWWPVLLVLLAVVVAAGVLWARPLIGGGLGLGGGESAFPFFDAGSPEPEAAPAVEGMEPRPATITAGLVPVGDADPPADFFTEPDRPGPVNRGRLVSALRAAVAKGPSVRIGVHVRELSSGEMVYGYRSTETSLLASNTKLFTTGVALDSMGPGHFLETRLLARGRLDGDGVLHGDLAVVGGGDPTLSWRQTRDGDIYFVFRQWAQALRDRGVTEVDGHIYLDHGLFEDPIVHPDWDPRKRLRWYQVPVDSLAFHENTVDVYAEPASRPGLPAKTGLTPDVPTYGLSSTVSTASSWRGNRLLINRLGGSDEITAAGGVYVKASRVSMDIAIDDPVRFFGDALNAALAEEGMRVRGRRVPVEHLPGFSPWQEVAVHRTSLDEVLRITNHESQNLFAETLMKLVGAKACGAGSWVRGSQAVHELSESFGVPQAGLQLHDGSGLSRENQATPSQVTAFLTGMARQPYRDAYVATLPTGGEDGTSLRKRLDEAPYPRNFFAKTGTLTGVSTLSGYARGRSGRLYAFSVLNRGGVWQGRQVQDAVVRALVDRG